MNILQLTPGTGSFYCGTCMRDNTLVEALRRLGHNVTMAPMYLPLVLDEPDAHGDAPLLYGGVNVYLQQKSAIFRHSPRWVDGVMNAAPVLWMAGLRAGMTEPGELGEMTVSMLRGEHGHQAKELDKLVAYIRHQQRDGRRFEVVSLSNALLAGLAGRIRSELGIPVVVTLQGEDYFLDGLAAEHRESAWIALREADKDIAGYVSVSGYYKELMVRRLGIDAAKVYVAYNGILLDGYGPPPEVKVGAPTIGFLTRMCAIKGLETLADAFVAIKRRGKAPGARLRIAGAMTKADEPFVEGVKKKLADAGVSGDAEFLANISREEKVRFLQSLSVLSVPATYGESFGLYVLEALACGVPVVQPAHGAFPELLAATGGGILSRPGDAEDLSLQWESLLLEPARAKAMGEAGRRAVTDRFSDRHMARRVLDVFGKVLAGVGKH